MWAWQSCKYKFYIRVKVYKNVLQCQHTRTSGTKRCLMSRADSPAAHRLSWTAFWSISNSILGLYISFQRQVIGRFWVSFKGAAENGLYPISIRLEGVNIACMKTFIKVMMMVLFQSFIFLILLTACYCFDGIKAIR